MAKSTDLNDKNMRNNQNQFTQEQMLMAAHAIKNAEEIKCSCGSNLFTEGMKLKKLSRLLTGEAEDRIIPVPVVLCIKCQKEPNFEEEQKKDNNEIIIDFKKKE